MAFDEQRMARDEDSHYVTFAIIGIVSVLLIGGFTWFVWSAKHSRGGPGSNSDPRLAGAIRKGSPEFEEYRQRIMLEAPEADEAKRALGDWVMTLQTTARNFTGRTIVGLEVHAAVVDHQDAPVKERTLIVIPGRQPQLEPNKTLSIAVMLEGMKDSDDRANIKMDVTAFKFQ